MYFPNDRVSSLLKIAFPATISSIMTLVGQLINLHIVSGSNAHFLYIIGLYFPIQWIVIALGESLKTTVMVCVANASARKNFNSLGEKIISFVIVNGFCIFILWMLLFIFFDPLCEFYKISRNNQSDFLIFSSAMLCASTVGCLGYFFTAILFAIKKSSLMMGVSMSYIFLGFFLNTIFSDHYSLGLYSLPLSTAICSIFTCFLVFFLLKTNKVYLIFFTRYKIKKFKYHLNLIKKTSIPIFMSYGVINISLFLFNKMISVYGQSALAGFNIAYQIQSVIILPGIMLGMSTAILTHHEKSNEKKILFF